MKFCVSVLAAFLLSITSPSIVHAAPNNPPEITADSTSDGTTVTVTGSVTDEDLSKLDLVAYAGAATPTTISVNPDGTFSLTLDVAPFVDEVVVKAIDAQGQIDLFTIYL